MAKDRSKLRKAWQARTKGVWKESRNSKPTKSLNVPEGVYIVRFTKVLYDADKSGDPYFMFRFTTFNENDAYHDQSGSISHFIKEPKDKKPRKNQDGTTWTPKGVRERLDMLAEDFQRLGKEVAETETLDDLADLADEITKEKPWGKVRVKFRKDPSTGQVDPAAEPNVYLIGKIEESDVPKIFLDEADDSDDDDEEDADDDGEDNGEGEDADDDGSDDDGEDDADGEDNDAEDDGEDDGEDDDGEDDDGEDDDGDEPPEDYEEPAAKKSKGSKPKTKPSSAPARKKKGDKVKYKGGTYTVTAVAANGSLTLKNSGGKVLRNINPDKLS